MFKEKILQILILGFRSIMAIAWLIIKIKSFILLKWFFGIMLKDKFEIRIDFRFKSCDIKLLLESTLTDVRLLTEIFFIESYYICGVTNPKLIVDAGANKGLSAVYFHTLWPSCEINCFEPNKNLIPILEKNLRLNNVNAKVYNYAISDKDGFEYFDISENHQYSKLSDKKTGIKVKTINVESFYDNKTIDILKLDVEGAEEKIINSLKKFNIDCIIGEIHHSSINVNRFFRILLDNYFIKAPRWQQYIANPTVKYPIIVAFKKN